MKMKVKQSTMYLLLCMMLVGLNSCDRDGLFQREQYEKVIYVLSGSDFTFPVVHSLNTLASVGYITIYAGGTLPVDQDISVTLEKDPNLVNEYNYSNFDLDKSKYAKELDPSRYVIKNYTAVLKAGSEDSYVKFPIEITAEGLSPDSTYLIPLKIVDDGTFILNKNKSHVLYKVYLANDFTSQQKLTTLFMRGTQLTEGDTGQPKQMSANKILYPLAKRTVRVNAGLENGVNKVDRDLIDRASMVMEIVETTDTDINGNIYNPVLLHPYKSDLIQIVQTVSTAEDGTTISIRESNRYVTEYEVKRIYLSYKYRTLKNAATEKKPEEWNKWIYVYENMKIPTDI